MMIVGRRLIVGKLEFQATDGLNLATLLFFSLLALIFAARIDEWGMLIAKNLGVAATYVVFIGITQRVTHRFWRFFLRVATVTLTFAYLFGAVDKLQLVLHGNWLDQRILDFEEAIFGVQPTLWLEQYTTSWLTEWMMFSYVIYVPMYPILCGIIYYLRGELPMEEYFFTLGFTNILCDIGFILFPVASPMYFIKELYTVPLDGYVFTFLGELMRSQLHFAGGSIPSPHAAAATIMWIMAYRYHRLSFYILTPIILSLYISTFYGRYHYVTDALVGIGVAFIALALAPLLMRVWDMFIERGVFNFAIKPTKSE
jgi:membrane-associated phospholipid phosphatase